jgi:hypothetical protein
MDMNVVILSAVKDPWLLSPFSPLFRCHRSGSGGSASVVALAFLSVIPLKEI